MENVPETNSYITDASTQVKETPRLRAGVVPSPGRLRSNVPQFLPPGRFARKGTAEIPSISPVVRGAGNISVYRDIPVASSRYSRQSSCSFDGSGSETSFSRVSRNGYEADRHYADRGFSGPGSRFGPPVDARGYPIAVFRPVGLAGGVYSPAPVRYIGERVVPTSSSPGVGVLPGMRRLSVTSNPEMYAEYASSGGMLSSGYPLRMDSPVTDGGEVEYAGRYHHMSSGASVSSRHSDSERDRVLGLMDDLLGKEQVEEEKKLLSSNWGAKKQELGLSVPPLPFLVDDASVPPMPEVKRILELPSIDSAEDPFSPKSKRNLIYGGLFEEDTSEADNSEMFQAVLDSVGVDPVVVEPVAELEELESNVDEIEVSRKVLLVEEMSAGVVLDLVEEMTEESQSIAVERPDETMERPEESDAFYEVPESPKEISLSPRPVGAAVSVDLLAFAEWVEEQQQEVPEQVPLEEKNMIASPPVELLLDNSAQSAPHTPDTARAIPEEPAVTSPVCNPNQVKSRGCLQESDPPSRSLEQLLLPELVLPPRESVEVYEVPSVLINEETAFMISVEPTMAQAPSHVELRLDDRDATDMVLAEPTVEMADPVPCEPTFGLDSETAPIEVDIVELAGDAKDEDLGEGLIEVMEERTLDQLSGESGSAVTADLLITSNSLKGGVELPPAAQEEGEQLDEESSIEQAVAATSSVGLTVSASIPTVLIDLNDTVGFPDLSPRSAVAAKEAARRRSFWGHPDEQGSRVVPCEAISSPLSPSHGMKAREVTGGGVRRDRKFFLKQKLNVCSTESVLVGQRRLDPSVSRVEVVSIERERTISVVSADGQGEGIGPISETSTCGLDASADQAANVQEEASAMVEGVMFVGHDSEVQAGAAAEEDASPIEEALSMEEIRGVPAAATVQATDNNPIVTTTIDLVLTTGAVEGIEDVTPASLAESSVVSSAEIPPVSENLIPVEGETTLYVAESIMSSPVVVSKIDEPAASEANYEVRTTQAAIEAVADNQDGVTAYDKQIEVQPTLPVSDVLSLFDPSSFPDLSPRSAAAGAAAVARAKDFWGPPDVLGNRPVPVEPIPEGVRPQRRLSLGEDRLEGCTIRQTTCDTLVVPTVLQEVAQGVVLTEEVVASVPEEAATENIAPNAPQDEARILVSNFLQGDALNEEAQEVALKETETVNQTTEVSGGVLDRPQNVFQNVTQAVGHQSVAEEVALNVPLEVALNAPQEVALTAPHEISQEVAEPISLPVPLEVCENVLDEVALKVPQEASPKIAEELSVQADAISVILLQDTIQFPDLSPRSAAAAASAMTRAQNFWGHPDLQGNRAVPREAIVHAIRPQRRLSLGEEKLTGFCDRSGETVVETNSEEICVHVAQDVIALDVPQNSASPLDVTEEVAPEVSLNVARQNDVNVAEEVSPVVAPEVSLNAVQEARQSDTLEVVLNITQDETQFPDLSPRSAAAGAAAVERGKIYWGPPDVQGNRAVPVEPAVGGVGPQRRLSLGEDRLQGRVSKDESVLLAKNEDGCVTTVVLDVPQKPAIDVIGEVAVTAALETGLVVAQEASQKDAVVAVNALQEVALTVACEAAQDVGVNAANEVSHTAVQEAIVDAPQDVAHEVVHNDAELAASLLVAKEVARENVVNAGHEVRIVSQEVSPADDAQAEEVSQNVAEEVVVICPQEAEEFGQAVVAEAAVITPEDVDLNVPQEANQNVAEEVNMAVDVQQEVAPNEEGSLSVPQEVCQNVAKETVLEDQLAQSVTQTDTILRGTTYTMAQPESPIDAAVVSVERPALFHRSVDAKSEELLAPFALPSQFQFVQANPEDGFGNPENFTVLTDGLLFFSGWSTPADREIPFELSSGRAAVCEPLRQLLPFLNEGAFFSQPMANPVLADCPKSTELIDLQVGLSPPLSPGGRQSAIEPEPESNSIPSVAVESSFFSKLGAELSSTEVVTVKPSGVAVRPWVVLEPTTKPVPVLVPSYDLNDLNEFPVLSPTSAAAVKESQRRSAWGRPNKKIQSTLNVNSENPAVFSFSGSSSGLAIPATLDTSAAVVPPLVEPSLAEPSVDSSLVRGEVAVADDSIDNIPLEPVIAVFAENRITANGIGSIALEIQDLVRVETENHSKSESKTLGKQSNESITSESPLSPRSMLALQDRLRLSCICDVKQYSISQAVFQTSSKIGNEESPVIVLEDVVKSGGSVECEDEVCAFENAATCPTVSVATNGESIPPVLSIRTVPFDLNNDCDFPIMSPSCLAASKSGASRNSFWGSRSQNLEISQSKPEVEQIVLETAVSQQENCEPNIMNDGASAKAEAIATVVVEKHGASEIASVVGNVQDLVRVETDIASLESISLSKGMTKSDIVSPLSPRSLLALRDKERMNAICDLKKEPLVESCNNEGSSVIALEDVISKNIEQTADVVEPPMVQEISAVVDQPAVALPETVHIEGEVVSNDHSVPQTSEAAATQTDLLKLCDNGHNNAPAIKDTSMASVKESAVLSAPSVWVAQFDISNETEFPTVSPSCAAATSPKKSSFWGRWRKQTKHVTTPGGAKAGGTVVREKVTVDTKAGTVMKEQRTVVDTVTTEAKPETVNAAVVVNVEEVQAAPVTEVVKAAPAIEEMPPTAPVSEVVVAGPVFEEAPLVPSVPVTDSVPAAPVVEEVPDVPPIDDLPAVAVTEAIAPVTAFVPALATELSKELSLRLSGLVSEKCRLDKELTDPLLGGVSEAPYLDKEIAHPLLGGVFDGDHDNQLSQLVADSDSCLEAGPCRLDTISGHPIDAAQVPAFCVTADPLPESNGQSECLSSESSRCVSFVPEFEITSFHAVDEESADSEILVTTELPLIFSPPRPIVSPTLSFNSPRILLHLPKSRLVSPCPFSPGDGRRSAIEPEPESNLILNFTIEYTQFAPQMSAEPTKSSNWEDCNEAAHNNEDDCESALSEEIRRAH